METQNKRFGIVYYSTLKDWIVANRAKVERLAFVDIAKQATSELGFEVGAHNVQYVNKQFKLKLQGSRTGSTSVVDRLVSLEETSSDLAHTTISLATKVAELAQQVAHLMSVK